MTFATCAQILRGKLVNLLRLRAGPPRFRAIPEALGLVDSLE